MMTRWICISTSPLTEGFFAVENARLAARCAVENLVIKFMVRYLFVDRKPTVDRYLLPKVV